MAYLGRVVGQGQIQHVAVKVQAVEQFITPTTKKETMHFLGLVGYYRCFCHNFSSIVAPLTDLHCKKVKYLWSPICQQAFEQVKKVLCAVPVLAALCPVQPFQLHVDASHDGAGAVLVQQTPVERLGYTDHNPLDIIEMSEPAIGLLVVVPSVLLFRHQQHQRER